MTTQVAMLLAILAAMSVSFFAELLPISFTALMVPVLLQATGILKPAEAWAGFSNTTIITWYGLFVIGGAFTKTSFTKKIRDFVNRNAKGSSLRVTLIVLIACSVIGIMTSAGGTIALLSPLLLEICKDTGMDPKKLFKPTADVCNWASVQMLPVGGSIAYLMWFNSYLEQADEDDLIILFSYTGIYFDYEYPNRRIPQNVKRPKVWFITGNTQVKKSEYINEVLYFSSRQNQPSHPYQLQAVGDIIAQSYAHYLEGKQKPGE